MKNTILKRFLALALCLCMLLGASALADDPTVDMEAGRGNVADFEALYPLMDLVSAASMYSVNKPETVPGADGTLGVSFIDAFVKAGLKQSASVGVTEDMLANTDAQAVLLRSIFAAQLPQLEPVVPTDDINSFIGFHPVTVNTVVVEGGVQIVGEVYMAPTSLDSISDADFGNIEWLDRGIFTFQNDPSAQNGFRLTGFSVGTELNMEEALQTYFEEIAVEYVDSNLGFTVLYPSIFDEEMLVSDESGVSAELEDGSVSFFAKRVDNVNGTGLQEYVSIIANGITGSVSSVNEEMLYGTVAYTTDDGFAVFDVFIVTDKYVYQAELRTLKTLMKDYSMYNTYLENSFQVNEDGMPQG